MFDMVLNESSLVVEMEWEENPEIGLGLDVNKPHPLVDPKLDTKAKNTALWYGSYPFQNRNLIESLVR